MVARDLFAQKTHKIFRPWVKMANLRKLQQSAGCITIPITHKALGVTWQSLVSFPLSGRSAQCCHLQNLKVGEPNRLPLHLCSCLSCVDFLQHKGTGCSSLVSHHLQPKTSDGNGKGEGSYSSLPTLFLQLGGENVQGMR